MLTIELPLAGITVWIPGVIALGFVVGFLTGMFGVGGGFILTPFLKIVFGIPYPIAVGSDLVQIFINSSLSAWRHWRNGSVDIKLGAIIAVGAILGTETGVRIQDNIAFFGTVVLGNRTMSMLDFVLNSLFFLLMLSVAVTIWCETSNKAQEEVITGISSWLKRFKFFPLTRLEKSGIESMSVWIPMSLSFFVGILTGLMGVGGGFVNFPLLVYVIGVPTLVAAGTSAFQIVFASAYGAVRHGAQGHIELLLVALLILGSIVGVQLGVRLSHVIGGRRIRKMFGFVLLAGMLLIVWDFLRF